MEHGGRGWIRRVRVERGGDRGSVGGTWGEGRDTGSEGGTVEGGIRGVWVEHGVRGGIRGVRVEHEGGGVKRGECITIISIYKRGYFGISSNRIGSLSLANRQSSPPGSRHNLLFCDSDRGGNPANVSFS